MSFLDILLMVVAVFLIILSLLQSGKSDGLSGAFTGGEGLNLFANVKERGPEKVIANLTLVVGILFFALVIITRIMV
ncbi:MAG: preprotein translocase subunit SecG [Erysipelotrichaceae bacterium]|nr:preprotein translocase subunit SecG [Erysipelotrichaceae bacterium]